MPITLEAIAERTRETVDASRRDRPLSVLQDEVLVAPEPRPFFEAMTRDDGRVHVIAECKRRSPSAGTIRDDFDPVDIALQYENAGAVAISCLTDEPFFGGSLADLSEIRGKSTLPILRKDFLVDAYQVWEARAAGADAILLISELLESDQLGELVGLADELGMASLIELHGAEQLDSVLAHAGQGHLLGVNNRNLRTMTTDTNHILGMLDDLQPHLDSVVCESGIRTHEDIVRLQEHGLRNYLVGESLLRKPRPGAALRTLIGGSD